jgi:hypothetical protein
MSVSALQLTSALFFVTPLLLHSLASPCSKSGTIVFRSIFLPLLSVPFGHTVQYNCLLLHFSAPAFCSIWAQCTVQLSSTPFFCPCFLFHLGTLYSTIVFYSIFLPLFSVAFGHTVQYNCLLLHFSAPAFCSIWAH